MWSHEYTAETDASPAQVWRVLADLDSWGSWDTSMEWVRLEGPLRAGSTVVMKPPGTDPIRSTIVTVEPERCYADRTELAGVTLDFSHTMEPTAAGGTRVRHRLEITGDGADTVGPQLGAEITVDFPDAMAAMLARVAAVHGD